MAAASSACSPVEVLATSSELLADGRDTGDMGRRGQEMLVALGRDGCSRAVPVQDDSLHMDKQRANYNLWRVGERKTHGCSVLLLPAPATHTSHTAPFAASARENYSP